MTSDISLAYLAGFFDGEGCVTVGNNGSLVLGIVNTHLPILNMFKSVFGGSVASRKQRVNKAQFVWRVYGQTAVDAATLLAPLTIEKKEQLVVAIDWMTYRSQFKTVSGEGKGRYSDPRREAAVQRVQNELTRMKKESY